MYANQFEEWAKFLCPIIMPTGFLDELTDCKNPANLSAVDNTCDDVVQNEEARSKVLNYGGFEFQ